LISKGELKAKTYRHAFSLLELDHGQTYTAVSKTVQTTIATVSTLADQYRENGLQASRGDLSFMLRQTCIVRQGVPFITRKVTGLARQLHHTQATGNL
jgi:hypothetical protein